MFFQGLLENLVQKALLRSIPKWPQSVGNFQMDYIFRSIMVTKLNAMNCLIGLIAILETNLLTTYILKYYMFIFFIIALYIKMFFN